jgi:hypothetical protein
MTTANHSLLLRSAAGSLWLSGLALVLGMVLSCGVCQGGNGDPPLQTNPDRKITFDLSSLNSDGLYGPPDGLRALHYEFCIPANPDCEAQVRRIDPTVSIMPKSRGRIGCSPDEFLCVGSTHQPRFRMVLSQLARLPYVKRINQAVFE